MRISDWSSDVCSSDLVSRDLKPPPGGVARAVARGGRGQACPPSAAALSCPGAGPVEAPASHRAGLAQLVERSEEHTSELQSLMRISYAVFCLKKKIIILSFTSAFIL